MLYFNANAGAHLPLQPHMYPQMLSDPEDEDPFTSTSPQQDSSGEFVCTYVCECVCVCVRSFVFVLVYMCISAKHLSDSYNVVITGCV